MLKYITVGSMVLLMLAGCGGENSPLNSSGSNSSEVESGSSGIVAGAMEPSLTLEAKEDGRVTFSYEIQNQTENIQTIHFPSSQKYDYKLYDDKGNHIQTYSADKSFVKQEEELEVKQAEVLDYTITVDQLTAGTYTLEVWLATEGQGDYKQSIKFTID
ncbi:BsuPI-related putative proteinase inhibitor [Pseudalkalibacillus hwajinpoensis]|uniref:BsuPI-related putative proteinase inhibitor n=1 Tax=Guptibacillus hwajinpoensis TaxID=208199 RepID=UPI00325B1F1B